jgi:DNA helicase-2/ATP-dependent DNA helicase PcrA
VPFGTIIENLIIFYNTLTENLIDINEFKKDITNISNEELIIRNKIVDSYVNYINLLKKLKLMDFSLLLRNAFELLKDEKILNSITKNINYFLIDEFQDINPLQWKIFYNLTKDSKKITVVGDVNQSIYGFRGSNPNIFEKFKEEFKDVKIIELNDNFRSRIGIINVSNNFLSNRKKIEITC